MSNCRCSNNANNAKTSPQVESPGQASRRSFFGVLGGMALSLVALPKMALGAGKKYVAIPLAKAPKLQNVGGSIVTMIRGQELLVVRDSATTAHAFEAKCPHEQCDLNYAPDSQKIECPCHAALFDLTGKVLEGPPPRPLQTYAAVVDGERIILTMS
jgi:nitrite reductase/ring-hydroxylating ferredoxin subunit